MRQVTSLQNLRVLVTGASGFLGQHLCRRLLDMGSEIHATSRKGQVTNTAGQPVWWQADMADIAEARRLFSTIRPDVVYHLAGSVGASPTLELVLPTYQSLLTSAVNMLVVAAEYGCRRVVLVGSLTEPMPDLVEPIPQSPYAAAKWAVSAYGRMFHSLYRTPIVILRPFMTYGPGQSTSKLIPSITHALLRGEAPRLSSGRLKADWVYVTDVIDGFLAAATTPGIEGQTIELGSGLLISIRHIVERLIATSGTNIEPLWGALPDRPSEQERTANTTAAFELLGWRASTALDCGLRQTFASFKAEIDEYKQPKAPSDPQNKK